MNMMTASLLENDSTSLTNKLAEVAKKYLQDHWTDLRFLAASKAKMFTEKELEALKASGVDVFSDPDLTPLLNGEFERLTLLETAFSTQEAARFLSVSTGRLRQRVMEGTISAMKARDGTSWAFPSWQFHNRGELPGLSVVMKAIPDDLNAVDTYSFFTTPQAELEDANGEEMRPIDFLLKGGDPSVVAELGSYL